MSTSTQSEDTFDQRLRIAVYRLTIRNGRVPTVIQTAAALKRTEHEVRSGLQRLSQTHAFMLQENGELWRAAPFSAVPTAFPVEIGKRLWWANCIWGALGIPAMLHKDARIPASCGCCNHEMVLNVKQGRVSGAKGVIHIAVPARHWYDDVVFT